MPCCNDDKDRPACLSAVHSLIPMAKTFEIQQSLHPLPDHGCIPASQGGKGGIALRLAGHRSLLQLTPAPSSGCVAPLVVPH